MQTINLVLDILDQLCAFDNDGIKVRSNFVNKYFIYYGCFK
jgi:hypothetical protein